MEKIKDLVDKKDKILITAALPYANGIMHIGHLLEHIQADIYTRFLQLIGKDVLFICGSDMHGTPIEINATKAGLEPEIFAMKNWKEQKEDFGKFLVKYDNYYHTNTPENKELAQYLFNTLKEKGYIYLKDMQTMFCDTCRRYLPDRYVKGVCPHCGTEDQYGDICEKCSTVLKGIDLKQPKCTICGNQPQQKTSKHYFFKLTDFSLDLKAWINDDNNHLQKEMVNWVRSWLDKGLEDWCISRDEPYFGFEIPGSEEEAGEKKYLYVWLDAPIGYISSTKNYLDKKSHGAENANPQKWEYYWKSDNAQVIHFIGKDIIYFHYLFWPMMLKAMEIPMPVLTTHGFVNINSQKMSKSRGTFFTAREFHELYGAEGLRFYFASHLDRSVTDIDLNLDEFQAVNNNVLIGNIGNFCYRTLSFAAKNYQDGFTEIANGENEKKLVQEFEKLVNGSHGIKDCYLEQNFKVAVKQIMKISDLGNTYFQKLEPWRKRETEEEEQEVAKKVAFMVNLARNLSILIKPIIPEFSAKVEKAFGVDHVIGDKGEGLHWNGINFTWTGKLNVVEKLAEKIEVEKLEVEEEKTKEMIEESPDKFPVEIRAGQIKSVNDHPNADKLYLLQVSFGDKLEERQIVSGLRNHFEKSELVGKKALFCTNLKAAKFRGELSQGMILMAEDKKNMVEGTNEGTLYLLEVPENTELGEQAIFPKITKSLKEIEYSKFQKYPLQVFEHNIRWKGVPLQVNGKDLELPAVPDESKIC